MASLINWHEFEQGDSEETEAWHGSQWGYRESNVTKQLNNSNWEKNGLSEAQAGGKKTSKETTAMI